MNLSRRARAEHIFEILDTESPPTITFLTQKDPFRLLISVILSAQTTDRQVNEVTKELFSRYSTPEALAAADIEEVKEIIRSTGYYNTKAKNIIETAQAIVNQHHSLVPYDMEKLVSLPGVGRKTANVILGQLADKPAIIVDTHFKRVVKRIGLTDTDTPDHIEREVAILLPPERQYRFSMIVNLHGRQVCHAKKPACNTCSIAPWCLSYPIQ